MLFRSHAYILSSTDSLTEFIQRRGRILRIEENKPISKIYDLVMLPQDITSSNFYPSIEDAYLVSRELRRMEEYNKSSENKEENNIVIKEIKNKYYDVLENIMQKQEAINELIQYILLTERDSYINNPRRSEKDKLENAKKIQKKLNDLSEKITKEY